MKKIFKNALFVLIPLLIAVVIHLLFAYGSWELNPSNWSSTARNFSAILMVPGALFGIIAAGAIRQHLNKSK